jgi:hypothetical protein
MGQMRNVYKILLGKSEENRLLDIQRHRWDDDDDDDKINLRETGWEGLDWIHPIRIPKIF